MENAKSAAVDVSMPRLDNSLPYPQMGAGFRWDIPPTFNFATDVVDMWAMRPDLTALIWENADGQQGQYSYAEISILSQQFANVLLAQGIEKGDRLIVMLPRIPQWQIAMVGALRIGAVPIPCIEMLTDRDLTYRIEHAGATGVVCRSEHCSKFDQTLAVLDARICLGEAGAGWLDWDSALAIASTDCPAATVHANDPVLMYYTSGSTGHPKGVLHAARALYAWRVAAQLWLDLSPTDRIWCTADTGWSKAGTSVLFGPWSCGACAFVYDGGFQAAERLRLLQSHRITVYCAPATELYRLVNEPVEQFDLASLRRTVSAGEAMNPAIAEKWRSRTGLTVAEAYGQTEVLMLVMNFPGQAVKFGSMGLPQPGCDVDVVDADGKRLPNDEPGEIAVLTPNPQLMLEYWQDEEKTRDSFREGPDGIWFLTGDTGYRDADGYLWYCGRSDDVITSAGYRIGPLEVENALLEHQAVQECAVVGSPDAERGEIVKAFIVVRDSIDANDALGQALQAHVKLLTAPYKYPRNIEFVEELPKTMTGKIRRRALRDREFGQL